MNIFSIDSHLGRFLYWTADIFILNLLWLIFSLPIVTIGASTTALYYAIMKRHRRDEGYIHKNFLNSFKSNFKQSTFIWILMLIIAAALFFDYRIGLYFIAQGNIIGKLFIVISVLLFIPYSFTLIYIFPVQAKFENTVKDNIKNAFLMSIGHLGYTFILLLLIFTYVFFTLTSRAFIGVVILFGASLFAFLTGNIFITVFRKHLPHELEEDLEAIGKSKFD